MNSVINLEEANLIMPNEVLCAFLMFEFALQII